MKSLNNFLENENLNNIFQNQPKLEFKIFPSGRSLIYFNCYSTKMFRKNVPHIRACKCCTIKLDLQSFSVQIFCAPKDSAKS